MLGEADVLRGSRCAEGRGCAKGHIAAAAGHLEYRGFGSGWAGAPVGPTVRVLGGGFPVGHPEHIGLGSGCAAAGHLEHICRS